MQTHSSSHSSIFSSDKCVYNANNDLVRPSHMSTNHYVFSFLHLTNFFSNIGNGHGQILSLLDSFTNFCLSKNFSICYLIRMIFILVGSECDRRRQIVAFFCGSTNLR
mmetsp:Transcript_118084/g.338745  ORF Transcript_118084/g.338745 Transcript_118084/m.338745 type:complete len:108 (+) Transcript_118084:52-375(+)